MSALSRILNVFRSRRVNHDIDEELQSHVDEARDHGREAKRSFGAELRTREGMRDSMVAPWLESIAADVAFGWRQLLKHKAASAAAIISLGLGIGSCTAAFRLIDALLLRPLPVADPGSLYSLGYEFVNERGQTDISSSLDYPGFRLLRAAVKNQAELMAISFADRVNVTYGAGQELERVHWEYVSGWTFAEFGLKPALGRLLAESDDLTPGAHPYAVLSYDYWTHRFGRDPAVIGRKFRNGNDTFEIVGVAPAGFTGTETGMFTDIFLPTMMNAPAINEAGWHWLRVWVRLKPGADREQVREKLRATLLANRRDQVKAWMPGAPQKEIDQYVSAGVVLEPAAAGVSDMQKTYRRALGILGALVAMVLFIACVNVANLMTAQAASRAREMALRVSIGAGRGRLIQLVLTESALIAVAASILGSFFAWWAAPFVVGMINPPSDPARLMLPADWRVTAFAVALALTVAILFGLGPALRASSVKPASALKGGDDPHARRRLMNALVAAQVAFCFLVHFVAGLFISTFDRVANQPTGFSTARILALDSISTGVQTADAWYQAADHLRSYPGVESAAVAGWALMSGTGWNGYVWANGHTPEGNPPPWFLGISPNWLETMKVRLLDGRDFRPGDSYPEVAMVNETFARRYFNGQSPVGHTLETQVMKERISIQIVGLVSDARYTGMRGPIAATVYAPFRRKEGPSGLLEERATFIVRTKDADPTSIAALLRAEVPRGHPAIRVANIRTQEELVLAQTVRERMLAMLSLFFAVVALVLAGVGLYGVLDYAVLERRRELGIRIALGARAGDIVRRVTIEVFGMLALGAAAGLGLGLASERYIGNLLYQVKTTDPSILALPAITILATALLAAFPPVLRAVRIDPTALLRAE
jgi:putative ABC transport system permease protein